MTEIPVDTLDHARELLIRHNTKYEVSPYFVVLQMRTFGIPPSTRRIQAGFDVELYGNGFHESPWLSFSNGELPDTLNDLYAACRIVAGRSARNSNIEIVPLNGTLFVNVKSQFEPEAVVRIRITGFGGLEQPAGSMEERTSEELVRTLDSLGVKRRI